MSRIAVVLFNLGGPDSLEAVKPFLFNLFNDKAIISVPAPVRYLIASIISSRRAPIAQEIYKQIGGKSPILDLTNAQAIALEKVLGENYKVFTCMRYWHPMSDEVAGSIKKYAPEKIIILPLYPQFSTTTSGSSFADWEKSAKKHGINVPTHRICCYPDAPLFIKSHADLIRKALEEPGLDWPPRLLFSAHGLPKKVVEKGDPYQWQVEITAKKIVQELDIPDLDWRVCYQSKVGPLEWLTPSTEEEIIKAGKEQKSLVVIPVAFVSEHSETLVELDMEYRHLADKSGVPTYIRVPALGENKDYIAALKSMVEKALNQQAENITQQSGKRICPHQFVQCQCM